MVTSGVGRVTPREAWRTMSHHIEFQVLSLRMVAAFVEALAELEHDGLIEREVAIRLRSWYASRHPRHRIGNKAVFATAPGANTAGALRARKKKCRGS